MGAPKNNRFWEARAKHGRETIFDSPVAMWEAAVEYFNYNEDHPRYELDFRGKDATEVELPKLQPLSIEGLCLFWNVNTAYLRQFKSTIAATTGVNAKDFTTIITRIEEVIFKQQYDGAASGFLNQNIIARKLGLSEKIESKVEAKIEALDYKKLDEETMQKLIDASADRLIEG